MIVFQIFSVLQYCHDSNSRTPGQFDVVNLDGDALGMVAVLEQLFEEAHHSGLGQDLNNFKTSVFKALGVEFCQLF